MRGIHATAIALGCALFAGHVAGQSDDDTGTTDRSAKRERAVHALSKLDGLTVWSFERQELGEIEDLVIDPRSGRVKAVVIDPRFEGIEEKRVLAASKLIVKRESHAKDAKSVASAKVVDLRNAPVYTDAPKPRRCLASKIVGKSVLDGRDESLGEIEELYVDPDHWMVGYATVGMGGFLGIGESLHTVPYRAMNVRGEAASPTFVLPVSHEALKSMPHYPKDDLPELGNPEWAKTTYERYAVSPYWDYRHGMIRATELPGREIRVSGMEGKAEIEAVAVARDGSACWIIIESPRMEKELLAFPTSAIRTFRVDGHLKCGLRMGKSADDAKRIAKGTWKENLATLGGSDHARVIPATMIIGKSITGGGGENIGEVEDLLLSMEDGAVRYAIAGIGGFLGIGEANHPIPWARVKCSDGGECTIGVTEAHLKRAPVFKAKEWPNVDDRWFERVESFWETITSKP